MRRNGGTLNPQLSRVVSETGHTDQIVVADAGLPIPAGSERIDLAYRPGAPGFFDVLDTVLAEMAVESATVAAEIAEHNPELLAGLRERFDALGFEIEFVSHTEFKARTHSARAFVRSGEITPYANVILHAGVAF